MNNLKDKLNSFHDKNYSLYKSIKNHTVLRAMNLYLIIFKVTHMHCLVKLDLI